SKSDSQLILGRNGAESLRGKGDMIFLPDDAPNGFHVQGCYVTDSEIQQIVAFCRKKASCAYIDAFEEESEVKSEPVESPFVDEMLAKAIELAIDSGQVSVSMLQRRLRTGYARAGRLIYDMTVRGIIAESEGNAKPRQVLITREEWNRMKEEDGF
ncbi:MAG: DNA translocase FtsK, partial [Clostridia bacterium]|nr:DNA translocase FtsK [Clostridia bacterium]